MSSHLFSKVSCFIKVLWVMMEDEDVAENWEEAADSRGVKIQQRGLPVNMAAQADMARLFA